MAPAVVVIVDEGTVYCPWFAGFESSGSSFSEKGFGGIPFTGLRDFPSHSGQYVPVLPPCGAPQPFTVHVNLGDLEKGPFPFDCINEGSEPSPTDGSNDDTVLEVV